MVHGPPPNGPHPMSLIVKCAAVLVASSVPSSAFTVVETARRGDGGGESRVVFDSSSSVIDLQVPIRQAPEMILTAEGKYASVEKKAEKKAEREREMRTERDKQAAAAGRRAALKAERTAALAEQAKDLEAEQNQRLAKELLAADQADQARAKAAAAERQRKREMEQARAKRAKEEEARLAQVSISCSIRHH